jgi:uncharacterized protein (DUF1330 family)
MSTPVYALNLFNVTNKKDYLAYSRRSAQEVAAHGGKVVALGGFRENVTGDIAPRQVLILVEWTSKDAFDSYCRRWRTCMPIVRMGVPTTCGICSTSSKTCGRC